MYLRGLSTWRRHLFLLGTKIKNGLTVVPTLVGALGFKLFEGVFSSFKSGLPHLFAPFHKFYNVSFLIVKMRNENNIIYVIALRGKII